MNDREKRREGPTDEPAVDEEERPRREPPPPEDPVDEASWESFPASDPPSFTPEKGT